MGGMMDVGFEHIYNLQNQVVYDVADVISTYVYRIGILQVQYSYTTAIGLFQSVISFLLLAGTNIIVKKMGENSLW
jgi:putative aldouronate transport system permease protein